MDSKISDMLLIGGGLGTEERLIVFQVLRKRGEVILIKFNATSVDELAGGRLYNQRPELIGKIRGEV